MFVKGVFSTTFIAPANESHSDKRPDSGPDICTMCYINKNTIVIAYFMLSTRTRFLRKSKKKTSRDSSVNQVSVNLTPSTNNEQRNIHYIYNISKYYIAVKVQKFPIQIRAILLYFD